MKSYFALTSLTGVSLIFAIFKIQNFITVALALISTCLIPGILLLSRLDLNLEFHELVPTSIVLSMGMTLFISLYLSITPFHITSISVLSSIFILATIVCVSSTFHQRKPRSNLREKAESFKGVLRKLDRRKGRILLMLFVGLVALFIVLEDILKHEYFLGYDPFITKPITISILQNNLDPSSFLREQKTPFSGFFFFAAAFRVSTGISLYDFTRFGGAFLLVIISWIALAIGYRIFNRTWSSPLVAFFFVTTPFVIDRFVMTIAENLSFLFLVTLVLFLLRFSAEKSESKTTVVVLGILFAAIFSTHPLPLLFACCTVLFLIAYKMKKDESNAIHLSLTFAGLIFVLPMLNIFFSWLIWVVSAQIHIATGWGSFPPSPWGLTQSEVLSAWERDISIFDFSIPTLALLPIGILGMFWAREKPSTENLFFVFPWSILALGIYFLTRLGFHFTPIRINIYTALPIAIFSGIAVFLLSNRLAKYLSKTTLGRARLISSHKGMKHLSFAIIVIPVFLFNFVPAVQYSKWSPYESSQVRGVVWLKDQLAGETDSIVIPSLNDITLVEYVGINDAILNRTLINRIMVVTSFTELQNLVCSEHPLATDCYFVISERWTNLYEKTFDFKLLEILHEYTEIIYREENYQGVIIFKFNLHQNINILKSDDGGRNLWVGLALDNRKLMKTFILNEKTFPNINSATILMALNKRDFDDSGSYEGNWFMEVNGHNHSYDWNLIVQGVEWVTIAVQIPELREGENRIVLGKQSPDHLFVGLDSDSDFNRSAFYFSGKWSYDELGKWYGTFDGEYMIRLRLSYAT